MFDLGFVDEAPLLDPKLEACGFKVENGRLVAPNDWDPVIVESKGFDLAGEWVEFVGKFSRRYVIEPSWIRLGCEWVQVVKFRGKFIGSFDAMK
jgi:hypothetical protein